MATKNDIEAPEAPAAVPLPTSQENVVKKSHLLTGVFLLTILGAAALAVGCVALVKAKDVEKDLDNLGTLPPQSQQEDCGEPVLQASYVVSSVFLPSSTLIFVPAWDYADLLWFGAVGNRLVYNAKPVYLEGAEDVTTADPVGTLSGDCMVTNSVQDLADIPGQVLTHCYLTAKFDGMDGTVAFGGIHEFNGNEYENAFYGGTGDWENFRGYLMAQFDPDSGVFSAKLYQTCA